MARSEGKRPEPTSRPKPPPAKKRSRPNLPQAGDESKGIEGLWKKVGIGAAAAAVLGLIVIMATSIAGEDRNPPENVETVAVDAPAHVEGEVDYDGLPAGGEHSAIWLNCGVYDQPVPEENAVHSLEHGAIWITYPTGADEALVDGLRDYARRGKVIVSPVDGQESPVMVTGWARRITADRADDPNINRFITEFISGTNAPEPGARCSGGVGDPL